MVYHSVTQGIRVFLCKWYSFCEGPTCMQNVEEVKAWVSNGGTILYFGNFANSSSFMMDASIFCKFCIFCVLYISALRVLRTQRPLQILRTLRILRDLCALWNVGLIKPVKNPPRNLIQSVDSLDFNNYLWWARKVLGIYVLNLVKWYEKLK